MNKDCSEKKVFNVRLLKIALISFKNQKQLDMKFSLRCNKKNQILILVLCVLFIFQLPLFGQQAFQYQAVVRDSAGVPIAEQIIGVQASIILDDVANPASYVETHTKATDAYGVLQLSIGDGMPLSGLFEELDWSQTSFIQIELDVNGGTNYQITSTTEILSVPRSLYALRAGSVESGHFGLVVTDFGAKGDGVTDDLAAFRSAIDSAALTGATVLVPAGVYQISNKLILPDGVRLRGEGMGSELLQTPFNGSLLRYTGTTYAIQLAGHASGVQDLVIVDQSNGAANGGIKIMADGRLVENTFISNVLVSNFVGGNGLMLRAINNGGIAYGTYFNMRVRNAKNGYQIFQDSGSFINSNSFYNGVISGGGFNYGLRVRGGNNNIFYGTVIEPPLTARGHLIVESGEIEGEEIRIEGVSQDPVVPLVLFENGTFNSTLSGTYAGGLTLDKGNNFINLKSGKSISYQNASTNLFDNPTFFSSDGVLPGNWSVTGAGVTSVIESPELTPDHQVLKVTVPAGVTATIQSSTAPSVSGLAAYEQVNFGFHVKTNLPGSAITGTNAPAGFTISHPHSGSNEWEFVGMNAFVNQTTTPLFQLLLQNTSGNAVDYYVTTPALSFGTQLPTLAPAPLTAAGGQLNGMLVYSLVSVSTPGTGFMVLPKTANYFNVTTGNTIARINHSGADQFPLGSVVTLLFDVVGTNVTSGAYLNLKSGFTSVANSSLTLMSNGNGTWREVSRNN